MPVKSNIKINNYKIVFFISACVFYAHPALQAEV